MSQTRDHPEQLEKINSEDAVQGERSHQRPKSFRGIAIECTLLKLLTKLVMHRLIEAVEKHIPDEQFGFRKNRSTTQAIQCLQRDIEDALSSPGGKLYTVFLDYTKVFDTLNMEIIIGKLEQKIGKGNYLARLIRNILSSNCVEICDNISKSNPIQQTVGVLQGDPLSPLLFIVATADIVRTTHENIR